MSTQKAILNENGTFRMLVDLDTNADETLTKPWYPAEPPADIPADHVLVETKEVRADGVYQVWSTRPKTDAEAQTVSTQLVLYSSLTATERRTLRTMANRDDPVGDIALQIEGAFYSAVETESRNPRTKQLIGAAMQLGILKDIDRARELLNDPGFSIE